MLTYIFVIAITAEAMSGALAAGRRNMDLFGVALIAFITALGGGTVRDMLLGNYPVTWNQHPFYIYITIGAGLFTIIIAKYMRKLNRIFLLVDAMGLVAFTIIGCNVAMKLDYTLPVVVMAGIITGIFGGILRDIMCNRTPLVLRHELYASVSFIVANFYLLLIYFKVDENLTLVLPFVVGLSLRMAALKWKLVLAGFHLLTGSSGITSPSTKQLSSISPILYD
ncbi:trimeric intracellular cation channel family protein [Oligella ureolytica]